MMVIEVIGTFAPFFKKENLIINIQGLVAEFPELIKYHIVEHFSRHLHLEPMAILILRLGVLFRDWEPKAFHSSFIFTG